MEIVGQQAIGILISVVIARRLAPADYGLVGMIAIFLTVATVFIQVGLPSALIRKPEVDPVEYDTVFLFNFALSILIYATLFLTAGPIAHFFAIPTLKPVSRVLFTTIIFNAASMVHVIVATKALNFRTQAMISVSSTLLSGSVGLWMAFGSWGFWALVAQQVVYAGLRSLLLWILIPWSPRLRFSMPALRGLMGFSSKLLLSGLLDTLFTNFYGLFVGKAWGQASLGYYAQAEKFRNAPLGAMNSIVQRVSFPVLSKLQGENERLRAGYRKLLRMVAFLTFPVLLFLATMAPNLFRTLLTEKWQPSVEIFQWLCLAGLSWGVSALSLSLLQVKGRSDLFLWLEIAKKFIVVTIFALTFGHGMVWMVRGMAGSMFLCVLLNFYYAGRQVACSLLDQLRDILPYLGVAILAGAASWSAGHGLSNGIVRLAVEGAVSVTVFFVLAAALKLEALQIALEIAGTRFPSLRRFI